MPIEAGDFKLISKALEKILKQKEFRPYIRGLSVWVGYKQSFVNYVREARHSGKNKISIIWPWTSLSIYKWCNSLFIKTTLHRNYSWFFFFYNSYWYYCL